VRLAQALPFHGAHPHVRMAIFRNTAVRFDERFIRAGWEDTDFFRQLVQVEGGQLAIANTVKVVHLRAC